MARVLGTCSSRDVSFPGVAIVKQTCPSLQRALNGEITGPAGTHVLRARIQITRALIQCPCPLRSHPPPGW